jgi:hypothetical protein
MVTKEQIRNGVKNYVNNEIVAKMQMSPNSIKRGLIITGINLWIDHNVESMLGAASGAEALGIVDTNGHFDIDKLASEFKKTMPDAGYKIDLAISGFHLGDMTVYGNDIDNLVNYIHNA